ncbi:hypothetical protein IJ00_07955 [Calothrix sp. 336/3]|nr:hypothetical protein IJ00_07955 [Calothrix sp. 336/3]
MKNQKSLYIRISAESDKRLREFASNHQLTLSGLIENMIDGLPDSSFAGCFSGDKNFRFPLKRINH